MIRCRVDGRKLQAKLKRMADGRPRARREAVLIMTGEVVRRALALSPTDTYRYYRGWAQAGRTAGLGDYAMPALRPGSWNEKILARLEREERFWAQAVAKWERIVRRYDGSGREDKWRADAVTKLNRAIVQHQKALTELSRAGAAEGGALIAFNILGGRRRPTVRHKVYGGAGRVVSIGDRTVVELHNKEPHASLVEWRYGVMRRASGVFRSAGLRKGGRQYIARMQEAARAA
jgi:hypothetical protein